VSVKIVHIILLLLCFESRQERSSCCHAQWTIVTSWSICLNITLVFSSLACLLSRLPAPSTLVTCKKLTCLDTCGMLLCLQDLNLHTSDVLSWGSYESRPCIVFPMSLHCRDVVLLLSRDLQADLTWHARDRPSRTKTTSSFVWGFTQQGLGHQRVVRWKGKRPRLAKTSWQLAWRIKRNSHTGESDRASTETMKVLSTCFECVFTMKTHLRRAHLTAIRFNT